MCDLLSGWINTRTHKVEIGDLRSHSTSQRVFGWTTTDLKYRREWEWTKDDVGESLEVRTQPDDEPELKNILKATLLSKWPTRQKAIWECIKIVAEAGGSLNLYGCTSLTSLPNNLKVNGSLNLFDCTSLTSLPNNLEVKGNLSIYKCASLATLPNDLIVMGNIYVASDSHIKHTSVENKIVHCY